MLQSKCRGCRGVLDSVEIGTVPDRRMKSPIRARWNDFHMAHIFTAEKTANFAQRDQL
ncbi:hypothetical protein ABIF38_006612 [Bradyrhizobium japonicum]|nr:hypothetical protein [Bradyrhizobium elkanii]MCS3575209.1 hypothetical protein [Bradyrhizobium elkanii]MCS3592100.1 hypothetical protein [Bradyrhizobium elkanii]MCS3621545.1 hypothetical protein [Bradyrhizobium elkanii]MCS4080210.1 hypothetical protein [Bradyrhizobium elkanii]